MLGEKTKQKINVKTKKSKSKSKSKNKSKIKLTRKFGINDPRKAMFPKDKNVNFKDLMISNVSEYSVDLPDSSEYICEIIKFHLPNIKKIVVTDATSNVGGGTIALSKNFSKVNAVELEKVHCKALRNNLNLYKLNEKVKTIDIVKSMMPGGSVIGCPKISTLNLLNKQEKENRNIYTGSFGYIKFNGDMKFNIIIRSILNFKNTSEISVASGVVIDSNANHEFNENFIKAKALIDLFK